MFYTFLHPFFAAFTNHIVSPSHLTPLSLTAGLLFLYEKLKMYSELMNFHMANRDHANVLKVHSSRHIFVKHACAHIHSCIFKHTHTHTHLRTHTHTHVHTLSHKHTRKSALAHTHTHANTHSHNLLRSFSHNYKLYDINLPQMTFCSDVSAIRRGRSITVAERLILFR